MALDQRPAHVTDLSSAPSTFISGELLRTEDVVGYYALPLTAKGRVQAVLELFQRRPLNPDKAWTEFAGTLATHTAIAIDSATVHTDLQRTNVELRLAYDATIEGWARALDLHDKETEGHSRRVTELAVELARQLGIGDEDLVQVRRGALLHDIGKMGVPDTILLKPGKLTKEEWEQMQRHATYAYELLSPIEFLRPALDIPYCHHEKWDGSGYPRGLNKEQIPLAARIFAVVDVWDALRSDRPYRAAWSEEEALKFIQEQSGTHFDPAVVQAFVNLVSAVRT